MYLKGIEVQGFKSFADKINLEFGQGVTTIVGPNGSGKSNVSDAIRWVLGEQSVKSLRGSRMEDVIFAGTQKRSPMGFAQVSIVLDNKDKIFNIDYDEVKVTRKLHRSGESDYYINNNQCRLRDIHELFMDTGIGREGYSVIGQGKIDEILSNKAEERRNIFEEASGITKFKYRRLEAEKKLIQADENLVRIKDLMSALEEQIGPLENQSKKARKYLDLREILKGLDVNISVRNIDKLRQNLEEGQKNYTIAFNHLNEEKVKIRRTEEAIEEKNNETERLNSYISELKEQAFNIEKSSSDLLGKIEILKNNINNNNENIKRREFEIAETGKKNELIKSEIVNTNKEIEQKQKSAKELEQGFSSCDEQVEKIALQMDELFGFTEGLKVESVKLLETISSSKAHMSSLDMLLKNYDERSLGIEDDINEKKKLLAETKSAVENDEKLYEDNKKKSQTAVAGLEKLKAEYFALVEKNDKAKAEQNELTNKLNAKISKKKILEELENGYEGYSKGVKKIIAENMKGVHSVVSKLLEVNETYVTAAEVALGNMLQNIVCDNEDVAKKCISYLKSNNLGRATFLPLTSVKGERMKNPPEKSKGYIGLACDIISYDKKYDDIFVNLLGKCVICDNLDNAVDMAKANGYKFKIVTLDGQQVNPGGSLTGGSAVKGQNLLSRTKDIEKLKGEIAELEKIIDKNDDIIHSHKLKINKMAEQKEELDNTLKNCEHEAVRINSRLTAEKKSLADIEESISVLTVEGGDIVSSKADVEKQKDGYGEKIVECENKIRELRTQLDSKQAQYVELENKNKELSDSVVQDKIAFNAYIKDIEVCRERIESFNKNIADNDADIQAKKADIEIIFKQNEETEAQIKELSDKITFTRKDSDALGDKVEQGQKDYDANMQGLRALQKQLKDQNETVYVLQQEVSKIENRNEKTEYDVENIINKLWEDYELTYNTAVQYKKEPFNMSEAVREASSLRGQIKALGNINLDSIEQYKEVKEKFDYMSAQKQDLDLTKEKLVEIITEIQTVMEKQFNESFAIIKEKFDYVFKALFGGGMGKLTLTDPDNVLESGIEIDVQPPGKKLQNMMALSGGERALSAIALLFSVLEVRPTPFCILDEVEAALDENNVYRFADYIKKYSQKTQFIVVTHRRGTMESADIMYGVTMQEKGVSKLLKLKFEDLEEYTTDGA